MTREEQIKLAAQEHREVFFDNESREGRVAKASFIAGAQWADRHPDISMVSALAYEAGRNDAIEEACNRWISVADELPKDGEYVATINTVGVKDVRHYSHGKWYSNFGNEYDDVTHWMPLPLIEEIRGNQGKISPNQQHIGTAEHIKIALDVIDEKGRKQ